jgi:hypothetical protein
MINIYEKNQILNNIFRNGSTTVYIGVSKTAPNEDGTNCTEPTAASYARYAAKCDSATWNESTKGTTDNAVVFRFNEAAESWTTAASPVTHWVIYDAATGGNMMFYGELMRAQEIPAGAILEIPENGLTTTILNA